MDKRRISRNERVAYHEAGHAVLSIYHCTGLLGVTIEASDETEGVSRERAIRGFRPDLMSNTRTRDIIERQIKVLNAGHWAEFELTGRNDWKGSQDDREKASWLASTQCGED